jgi:hypothetical protein
MAGSEGTDKLTSSRICLWIRLDYHINITWPSQDYKTIVFVNTIYDKSFKFDMQRNGI